MLNADSASQLHNGYDQIPEECHIGSPGCNPGIGGPNTYNLSLSTG